MKKYLPHLCLLVATTIVYTIAFGQKKDSTYIGAVKGIIFDSAHNYVLPSASVAVYKAKDSVLLSYQLTNNFGEFQFVELPVGILLKMVVSYSGYRNLSKKFTIPADKKEINLKKLIVERSDGRLEEVVVSYIPPVQMNGDTLEFNADAFHLDSNAVVEDLLRKLPGVTVWGDGEITVNGRKVNSVLVDGKPFFGGDTRVATQNLPKNAIDKIQVYQQKNEENPLDSTTNVNIKLKKNKKFGYFGKLGGGYGSDDRWEANASLNIYSPLTQFALVAAGNNTNKSAFDINTLMRNASYKGVGASVDYQPDFRSQGSNRPLSGGFTFQHDFIPDAGYEKNNRLTANYFVTRNDNLTSRKTKTTTALDDGSSLFRIDDNETGNINTRHQFNSKYEFRNQKRALTISPSFNINNNRSHTLQNSSSSGSNAGLQSTNRTFTENDGNSKNVTLNAQYRNQGGYQGNNHIPKNYQVDYTFYAGNSRNQQVNQTEFVSMADPAQNKNYDRRYNKASNDINQSLTITNDLKNLIFKYRYLGGINFKFQNYLYLNAHHENNHVADKDTSSKDYLKNQYLTNKSNYHTFNDMPGLEFSKSFNKGLANRYNKSVSLTFTPQAQFYTQKNVSQQSFQNFRNSYARFIPKAGINYTNNQFGTYQTTYSLDYRTSAEYPNVNQLAPLVDSSNVWYLQKGSPNLKPYYKQELSFSLRNFSFRSKNTFNYNVNIRAGTIKGNFVDSSIYDELGRTVHYTVNADGNQYISGGGNLNKAFKFKENQLQINASTNFSVAKNPSYVNGELYLANNFNNSNRVSIYYNFKDFLSINAGESLSFYHSVRKGGNKNEFRNSTNSTSFSASANVTKKLSLSSSITYNRNVSSGSEPIDFTIWNADIGYRFLKGRNAEIKFSALDLLHQNTSIISYGSNNVIVRGIANVLQQYFMVTFSYFPRKFGRKKHDK